MMTLRFIRIFFLVLSGMIGLYLGDIAGNALRGAQIGLLCGLVLIFLEQRMHRVSVRGLSSMVFGLLLGVFMAKLIADILSLLTIDEAIKSSIRVILTLVFSYLGAVMALRGKDEFSIIIPYIRFRRQDVKEEPVLLDTSAIIDGRIADIYRSRFLSGRLVVPQFVLLELQRLADSDNDIKRKKGRRGLEMLKTLRDQLQSDLHVHESEFDQDKNVDNNIVHLAKAMDAQVCTTDGNLERIATLQGVEVLNIHQLVNAVKSVVLIGEELDVKLVREGKEHHQAVAHLEDGTMVVVSDARDLIGQSVKVLVTSILQTQSGKVIFARPLR
jgi:uncharacterized protein YacL